MIRPVLYVFSKNEEMKNSISRYIHYVGIDGKKLKHLFEPEKHAHTYSVPGKITFTLDSESPESLLNTVVILDISDVDHDIVLSLNPSIDSDSTGQTLSSLILAYPEVYWIILGASFNKPNLQKDSNCTNNSNCEWVSDHFVEATNMNTVIELLERHQNGYRTIFDPSGLRAWIKREILPKKEAEVFKETNNRRRGNCAVVIEEEIPFAYLNGYTAYRFGYPCYMITSDSEIKKVLQVENKTIKISLEDIDIKLSGMGDEKIDKLRDLYRRAEEYEGLQDITSLDFNKEEFEQASLTPEGLCEVIINDNYTTDVVKKVNTLDGLNKLLEITNFFEILVLQKSNPNFSTDIWILVKKTRYCRNGKGTVTDDQKKLIKRLNRLLLEENYSTQTPKYRKKRLIITGIANEGDREKYKNDFEIVNKPYSGIYDLKKHFPKNISTNNKPKASSKSHSAPNRILTIANILIGRARKILDGSKSCEEFVLGAVLALEAKELLRGQSMTTALEAVSLQHQLEVKAECSFLGVAHEIIVDPRFEEIGSEVYEIIDIQGKPRSIVSAQSYNTQLEIVNNIRRIFNDYEQFDEEEQCIIKVRRLRQQLHLHQSVKNRVYSCTIEWYLNFLMSTKGYIPWRLGLASLCWILLFAEVLTCCYPTQFSVNSPDFHASEFIQPSALGKLCRKTTKDGLGKHIHARIDTVNRLNELLPIPNLYDSMMRKHPEKFTDDVVVNTLVKEIEVYKDQRYLNLEGDAQDTIKTLNRHLLEKTYSETTPKLDMPKIEGFSGSVFKKSARLYLFTFLELSHQDELNGKWLFGISILEILVAHVHLGIFISYLFQKLARR